MPASAFTPELAKNLFVDSVERPPAAVALCCGDSGEDPGGDAGEDAGGDVGGDSGEDPGGDSKIRAEMRAKIQRSDGQPGENSGVSPPQPERRRSRSRPRSKRSPGEESGGDMIQVLRPDSGTHAGAVARAVLKNLIERSKAWPQSAATVYDINVVKMLEQSLHLLTEEERNQAKELMMAAIANFYNNVWHGSSDTRRA